jgi:hypothetical protein
MFTHIGRPPAEMNPCQVREMRIERVHGGESWNWKAQACSRQRISISFFVSQSGLGFCSFPFIMLWKYFLLLISETRDGDSPRQEQIYHRVFDILDLSRRPLKLTAFSTFHVIMYMGNG